MFETADMLKKIGMEDVMRSRIKFLIQKTADDMLDEKLLELTEEGKKDLDQIIEDRVERAIFEIDYDIQTFVDDFDNEIFDFIDDIEKSLYEEDDTEIKKHWTSAEKDAIEKKKKEVEESMNKVSELNLGESPDNLDWGEFKY